MHIRVLKAFCVVTVLKVSWVYVLRELGIQPQHHLLSGRIPRLTHLLWLQVIGIRVIQITTTWLQLLGLSVLALKLVAKLLVFALESEELQDLGASPTTTLLFETREVTLRLVYSPAGGG